MKKMIFLFCIILFSSNQIFAQEKVDAPIWNVGDKWTFTRGTTMEVVAADENSYSVIFSGSKTLTIFDKSTLNRKYIIEEDKRQEFKGSWKRALNFPLIVGKVWKDKFSSRATRSGMFDAENRYFETFKVLGFEDVKVEAGIFKAVKIEYSQEGFSSGGQIWKGKAWFWYAPEAKYIVKCQYDKNPVWTGIYDWELTTFFDYSKAQEIIPKDAIAYNDRGFAFLKKGQYDLAISDFSTALELNPKYIVAYLNRALALELKGNYEQAISDLNRAVDVDPTSVEKIISDPNNILGADPKDPKIWFVKSLVLDKLNRRPEAIEAYKTFIQLAKPEYSLYVDRVKQRIKELEK
jgi:tetratricopeptide (TPR) repeat protein